MNSKYNLKLTKHSGKLKIYKLYKTGGTELENINEITQDMPHSQKKEMGVMLELPDKQEMGVMLELPERQMDNDSENSSIGPTESIEDITKRLDTLNKSAKIQENEEIRQDQERNQLEITTLESVKVPYQKPSSRQLYTIPAGKILYHGSTDKKTFDPFKIKLSESTLSAFFSPYKGFASDYIMRCSAFPSQNGYIHAFRVKKDIDKILILSPYELKNKDNILGEIDNNFCKRVPNREDFNGIGFFFPDKDLDNFSGDIERHIPEGATLDPNNAEFALCNPKEYLEYINTQECVSLRKLSEMYNFTA